METPNLELYRQEKENWKAQGKPERSDEQVAAIYDNICAPCEEFIKVPIVSDRGQCRICTCLLSKDGDYMNKIKWATTSCPLGKWVAEEGYAELKKETEPEVPTQSQQFIQRPPRNGGCGCN